MLLLKLDIAKAFDNVQWLYMLEVLQQLGFGQRWRDLLALLWRMTSSGILLYGQAGRPIKHHRGLRQGDPLSPMMFILAIDPLQRILDQATQEGILTPIGVDLVKLRTSLYADDAALFLKPSTVDIANLHQLLQHFGQAAGLTVNVQKSEIF
jgi:hypothetical protein